MGWAPETQSGQAWGPPGLETSCRKAPVCPVMAARCGFRSLHGLSSALGCREPGSSPAHTLSQARCSSAFRLLLPKVVLPRNTADGPAHCLEQGPGGNDFVCSFLFWLCLGRPGAPGPGIEPTPQL